MHLGAWEWRIEPHQQPQADRIRLPSRSGAHMRDLVRADVDASAFRADLARALSGDGPALLPAADPIAAPLHAPASQHPLPRYVDDNVALVIETSGSTAAPKRVALSADAIRASARATHTALGGEGQWLLALPLNYIAGVMVVVRSIEADTRLVVAPHNADGIIAAISRMSAAGRRYASVVPSQLDDLLDAADRDPSIAVTLRRVDAYVVGGQRIDSRLVSAAEHHGLTLVRTYGSSETSGGCVYDGYPIGDTRVRIGADGRIALHSASLADGYLDAAATTAAAFTHDDDGTRWWWSGDLGSVDASGRLTVIGRADDVIISGGIKVALSEVEAEIRRIPQLRNAVAVPVADPHWGQSFVVFAEGAAPTDAGGAGPESTTALTLAIVRDRLAASLGAAARPRNLVWLADGIPQTSTGKPDRRTLADKAARMEPSPSRKDNQT